MANTAHEEAGVVLDLLRQMGSTNVGLQTVYRGLATVAERYRLSDAFVVMSEVLGGKQVFRVGRRPMEPDRVAEALGLEPGLYTVPDVLPAVWREGFFSLAQLGLSLHLARRRAGDDPVTGLANGRSFADGLRAAAAQSDRYGWRFTLVLLELKSPDASSPAPETHSPAVRTSATDTVLHEFAGALRGALRMGDSAGRIGQLRFGLMLGNAGSDAVAPLLQRVGETTPSALSPWGLRVGVASAPSESVDPERLMGLAQDRLREQRDREDQDEPPSTSGEPAVASTDTGSAVGDLDLEIDLRELPDVVNVGVLRPSDGGGSELVVVADGSHPEVSESVGALTMRHSVKAHVQVLPAHEQGGNRPTSTPRMGSRVALAAVTQDAAAGKIEVRLVWANRFGIGSVAPSELGSGVAGGDVAFSMLAAAAQATLEALADMNLAVPFSVVSAEQALDRPGGAVIVVLRPRSGRHDSIGVARGETVLEASSRATLAALNRHLGEDTLKDA